MTDSDVEAVLRYLDERVEHYVDEHLDSISTWWRWSEKKKIEIYTFWMGQSSMQELALEEILRDHETR